MNEEGSGIWLNGKASKDEIALLQQLVIRATELFSIDGLPLRYDGEKLYFKAWDKGSTLNVYYGWKYPPKKCWVIDVKDKTECKKCLPDGVDGVAGREVWCEKRDYRFSQCPYGVITKEGKRNG